MPAQVAEAVDSEYARVRSALSALADEFGDEAETLRFRAAMALEDGGLGVQLGWIESPLQQPAGVIDATFGTLGLAGIASGLFACCRGALVVGARPYVGPDDARDDTFVEAAASSARGPGVVGGAVSSASGPGMPAVGYGSGGSGGYVSGTGNASVPTIGGPAPVVVTGDGWTPPPTRPDDLSIFGTLVSSARLPYVPGFSPVVAGGNPAVSL